MHDTDQQSRVSDQYQKMAGKIRLALQSPDTTPLSSSEAALVRLASNHKVRDDFMRLDRDQIAALWDHWRS